MSDSDKKPSDKKTTTTAEKSKYPAIKRKHIVDFNPEGNEQGPLIAIATTNVSQSGRLDLLVLPAQGGEIILKCGVPHASEFTKIENPSQRRNGSWGSSK